MPVPWDNAFKPLLVRSILAMSFFNKVVHPVLSIPERRLAVVYQCTINIVESAGNIGQYTSLQLGANGNPVISYHIQSTGGTGALKLARCKDATCSTPPNITIVDSTDNAGEFTHT